VGAKMSDTSVSDNDTSVSDTVLVWDDSIKRMGSVGKRTFDILFAVAMLLVLWPVLIIVAIMIKLESSGPVFFCQPRYGKHGKVIQIYKFRTMYYNFCDYTGFEQATQDDLRITRWGRFFRDHGIDELPQLFNVLLGNMSVVGPRPHPIGMKVEMLALSNIEKWQLRYFAKPGLTGLAQVNGSRGALITIDDARRRMDYDLHYIKECSFGMDCIIVLRTIVICINGARC
jgi:lipopolysaccharide/colanic/teichoic acid biosynthesis glycosyltransferase